MKASRSMRILVVDDEPFVLDSICRVLRFDGHAVEGAANPVKVLALLKEKDFDLVITDFEMPGMKGDKLAGLIHGFFPTLPIVLVTAYGEQLRSSANPLVGVSRVLGKPFKLDSLRQAVAELSALPPSPPASMPGPFPPLPSAGS